MTHNRETIVILDYGSQYTQLIARRVRELSVYCEVYPWSKPAPQVMGLEPMGFVLSGGPNSVYDAGAPTLPAYVVQAGAPVLGLCYGMQLLAHALGGKVVPAGKREYGRAQVRITDPQTPIFRGLETRLEVWMSHGDRIENPPPGFTPIAQRAFDPEDFAHDTSCLPDKPLQV